MMRDIGSALERSEKREKAAVPGDRSPTDGEGGCRMIDARIFSQSHFRYTLGAAVRYWNAADTMLAAL